LTVSITLNEYLFEAREELKRLEHIIYVSLKYTRTVDVIINALNRMVSTADFIVYAFLEKAKEEGLIETFPKSPALCATRVIELYPNDPQLQKYLTFYAFLKNVLKSSYQKREEYRRHVTLIVELDKCTVEVTIDNLMCCEKFMHDFFTYSWQTIMGKNEEDEFF
jgi:hypothetical protein